MSRTPRCAAGASNFLNNSSRGPLFNKDVLATFADAAGLVDRQLTFFHSRRIFPMRVIRRMIPSKRMAMAIWKLGLLTILSFLPIRFNVREYWMIMTNRGIVPATTMNAPIFLGV